VIRSGERPLRVLHALAISLPHINGYTIRSKYLVDTQRSDGLAPVVVTSPLFRGEKASSVDMVLAGTPYVRVRHPADDPRRGIAERAVFFGGDVLRAALAKARGLVPEGPQLGRLAALPAARRAPVRQAAADVLTIARAAEYAARHALLRRRFEAGLERAIAQFRPDLIHAHSPYQCGLAAMRVARRHRLPFLYEVRGLWGESWAVSAGDAWRRTRMYRWATEGETALIAGADAVACIGEQLLQEVLARGACRSRAVVVPNGVDPSIFRPRSAVDPAPSPEVRALRRRLKGSILGYVGSLRPLEGVDELVRGTAELVRRGKDVSLLALGHNQDRDGRLDALVRALGLGERAVITGPVPHGQTADYYDLMDVFVISRPSLRVTNLVTPLKPLEAMAMAKPVVVSDLAALRELVAPETTGLLYAPGNVGALADACARLLDDAGLRRRLGETARRWVCEHRTWPIVVRRLYPVYQELAERSRE
jgi:glycosyltransferase involved in cell wall biosynthesis